MLSPTNLNLFQLSKDVGGRTGEVTGTEQLEDIGETAKVERVKIGKKPLNVIALG